MRIISLLLLLGVAGCSAQTISRSAILKQPSLPMIASRDVPRNFITAVARMRPVLIETCKSSTKDLNCDFVFVIDPNLESLPNAFQTENEEGQPVLGFTMTLLTDMYNADEIAFVIGHEAAHHILSHLDRQKRSSIGVASNLGAAVGGRTYSKNYESEADRLGAQMTLRAGLDPVLGSAYLMRIPEPRSRLFKSHPRNADRIAGVRAAVAL